MDSTENTEDEPKIYRPKPKKLFIASTLKKHLIINIVLKKVMQIFHQIPMKIKEIKIIFYVIQKLKKIKLILVFYL